LNIQENQNRELPEQIFLKRWAANPTPISEDDINKFVDKVIMGLMEEIGTLKIKSYIIRIAEKLKNILNEKNKKLNDMVKK
jgi:transcription initiation factor TFIIIB Brf1 subunit/transcription initiation factor TFIIB